MADDPQLTAADPEAPPAGEPVAAMPLNVEEVLEEYRRRQMIEHMTGPMVSVIVHLVVLVVCFFFMVAPVDVTPKDYEVEIKDIQVKELQEKVQEKLQEIVKNADNTPVPTVDKPAGAGESEASEVTNSLDSNIAQQDVSIEGLSDVKFFGESPIRLAGVYAGRSASGRAGMMGGGGGGGGRGSGPTATTESAVLRALRWLKANQSADGSWSPQFPGAMTGLALLAFLAHGETPSPECKEFGETVNKGLQWLTATMMKANVVDGKEYSHAIATYALSEAYGMTKIPALKPAMEKGLATIIAGQQAGGGWDYNYSKDEGKRWDLSVAGWQIQALKAGFIAGAEAPGLAEALEKSMGFLQKTAFHKEKASFQYSKGAPKISMQGVGALCLQLMGLGKSEEAQKAVEAINKTKLEWNDLERKDAAAHNQDCYKWYYQTQAMFYAGSAYWKPWNAMMAPELTKNQKPDGHWECPPPAAGAKFEITKYDSYYSTTLCCLMLEVYYRFLPTYKVDLNEKKGGDSILDWGAEGEAKKTGAH